MNYGRLAFAFWDAVRLAGRGKRVCALGMLEGDLRSFECGVFLRCKRGDAPKSFFCIWGERNLPGYSEPPAYWTHLLDAEEVSNPPTDCDHPPDLWRRPWSQYEAV
jgi:hypothetical protein